MFLIKLANMFNVVGRLPGLGFLQGWSNRVLAKHGRIRHYRDEGMEMRDRAAESRRAVGLGDGPVGRRAKARGDRDAQGDDPGGENGDRTVQRPRGGARDDGGEDHDRTILRPRPGGRGAEAGAGRGRPRPGGRGGGRAPPSGPQEAVQIRGSGLNPLVDAAVSLFTLVGQLRNVFAHPDVDALRQRVVEQVQAFDAEAREAGEPPEAVLAARYSLCTLIDETVLSTPWGMDSAWSHQSILSAFHNETFGGEKFFLMLERATQTPARNLHLLEFMYLCMALGLEGKYRVVERGRAQLEQVQSNLSRTIRQQRGDFERDLSPRWRGVEDQGHRLARYVPLWAIVALVGVLLTAVYLGFNLRINEAANPVFASLGGIGRGAAIEHGQVERVAPVVAPAPRTLTLQEVLAEDIEAGRLEVLEVGEGTRVRVRGDGLFASASATVTEEVKPLLLRVADALEQFPGPVLVTGHTDSVPLSLRMQVRFPSNWHLSQERAESVATLLESRISDPGRIRADGRGENEPLAGNDTAEGRARNRRVEVTLLSGGGA